MQPPSHIYLIFNQERASCHTHMQVTDLVLSQCISASIALELIALVYYSRPFPIHRNAFADYECIEKQVPGTEQIFFCSLLYGLSSKS